MKHPMQDLQKLIARLAAGYTKRLTADEQSETLALWGDVMRDVPLAELERAVDALILEPTTYFPKAGEVRRKALGFTRKTFTPATGDTWDREPWEPGRGPNGEPLLCSSCGGDVTFRPLSSGSYLGHIEHKRTCGRATRIERPAGDFTFPIGTTEAERRKAYADAAKDAA